MIRPLMLLSSLIFCLMALFGCAKPNPPMSSAPTKPTSTQIEAAQKQLNAKIDLAYQHMQYCKKNLNESVAGRDVARQILILDGTQNNRYDLLKSKAKLSASQKNILINYLNLNIACNELLLTALKGTPILAVQEKSNLVLDRIYGALMAREISIGDANLLRYQMMKAGDREFNAAGNKFRLEQSDQATAEYPKERGLTSNTSTASNSSSGGAALLLMVCPFTKDPQACSAGALSGAANDSSARPQNDGFKFSDSINDDIKKQQLIEETKRQMQNDLDYEKRRKELLDYKAKSRQ